MAWRLAILLPLWLTKGVVDRLVDALAGPEEPFEYASRTQPPLAP